MKNSYSNGRRRFVVASTAVAVAALGVMSPVAMAQNWPDKPIRIIVPYAGGQGADVLARVMADELARTLKQPIVVENKAGAGGNIGAASAARAQPDGYTFLLGTNATNAANEFLYADPGYQASTDFVPVAMIGLLPMVISTAATDFPTNGIAELIRRAKAEPDTINVGLPSTTAQVVFSEFVRSAEAPMFAVRYKASGQSMTDVMGGRISLVIDTVTASRPLIQSGKLHALGITSLKGSDMLPGVKPVSEQGVPGFDVVAWDALFAPKGTPQEAIDTMSAHIQQALEKPEIQLKLQQIGVEPFSLESQKLRAFISDERSKWGGIIKLAGIHLG